MSKSWTRFLITSFFAISISLCEYYKVGIISYYRRDNSQAKIKKILIITSGRIEEIHGVNMRYLSIQRELRKKGIQVDIMDTRNCDIPIITPANLPPHALSFSLPKRYLQRYLRDVADENQVDQAYDAVHLGEIAAPQACIAGMTFGYYGIPFTMMYHISYDIYNRVYGNLIPEHLHPGLLRFFTRKATAVFGPTPSIIEQLANIYGVNRRKLVRLQNGIDPSVFNMEYGAEYYAVKDYLEKELKLQRPYLMCVARVAPEKNLEEFFKLAYPGSKVMVGGGPLMEVYRKKYPDVVFVGVKRGRELAGYYQNGDVFVFPSLSETFGAVMIEAMGCGLPVAAFPCTGPIDVVDNGVTGYLDQDLKAAVDACLQLERAVVYEGSKKWRAEVSAEIFLKNLVYIPIWARKRLFRENHWL